MAFYLLSFARKFGNKYGEEPIGTVTNTGIDVVKTAFKRVVQKTAEATSDLIGNKITSKTTSINKAKSKKGISSPDIPSQKIYIPLKDFSN